MEGGTDPAIAQIDGMRFCPSICFESTIPHLIRRQVMELSQKGTPPDVLVNLTNDGWFYGSSILYHHFCFCGFRAVANRKPMLISANTGISAHTHGRGGGLSRG